MVQGQGDSLGRGRDADRIWRRGRGPLSHGTEGTTKTKTLYKGCGNACWLYGYDVLFATPISWNKSPSAS